MTSKFSSKRPLTQEEEAEVQKMISADPDNPELTDDQIANAKPFAEAFPGMARAMEREIAKRGRPRVESPKEAVTIRLDPDVVAAYRERGPEWRARMADVVAQALDGGEIIVNAKMEPKEHPRRRKARA
ncbi:hypothetical protein GR158_12255 [Shinella sp. AETb1-6]|nr:BrnA antitoxin family protein [Shinella sp. AETb1-6]MXN51895.1 hypothetical protein [Shinella sp. AETb1-6]